MSMIIDPCRAVALLAALAVLCGCAGRSRPPPQASSPRATPTPAPASPYVPRPAAPAAPGKPFPACDPRAGDPDREHVAFGLIAGDCQDERGRNRVYVTRFATVKGEASPAARAGIKLGDRVVRVDSCEVVTTNGFAEQLRNAIPGWVARLVVERGGQELEVFVPSVRLAARSGSTGSPSLSTAGCASIGRKGAQP